MKDLYKWLFNPYSRTGSNDDITIYSSEELETMLNKMATGSSESIPFTFPQICDELIRKGKLTKTGASDIIY